MPWTPPDHPLYAYLLGAYLGDGYISTVRTTHQLVIVCDLIYPRIIEESREAMIVISQRPHVGVNQHPEHRCARVVSTWKEWPVVFPQHGPGMKHTRPILLEPWQREIVAEHPWRFLRGLLHSDGCRTINRFKTTLPSGRVAEYAYPRWFFSNVSADIRGLFCATCEQVGVRWTLSNHRNVSVSHRRSVALLDEHVGGKG